MTSKIKALALAFVAIAALSAVAASAAQAGKFDIGAQPAVITGTSEAAQEPTLTITPTVGSAITVKCQTASFEGTTQGNPVEEATVTATYGIGQGSQAPAQGCTCNGIKCQVLMDGCKYTITGEKGVANEALVDIVGCTEGKQITIIPITGCQFGVGNQNGLSKLVSKQLTAQEVTAEAKVTGITVQQGGQATCPDGPPPAKHTSVAGAFTANTILKAFQDVKQVQVTKHNHQYNEHVCGTQVNIQST